MEATFPVEWKRIAKSLFVYVTIVLTGVLVGSTVLRYVSSGFDYHKTFEHVSLLEFLLILAGVPVLSFVVGYLVGFFCRNGRITLSEGAIHGSGQFVWRNRIPLNEITSLAPFSNNGINGFLICSKYHGKIFVYQQTERLDELLVILNEYLPEDARL